MDEKKKTDQPGLEGEGSYTGAKRYDDEAEKFAREEDVGALGKQARDEVEKDPSAYREAERQGKQHIAEEDPELKK